MDEIMLRVDSPRYKCDMTFRHKVNIISGDSGEGKSTFVQKIRRPSTLTTVSVSNDFDFMILDNITFMNIVKRAIKSIKTQINEFPIGNSKQDKERRYKLLYKYWSTESNFPIVDSIILIDDDDFVTSYDFAALFNADKYNMYVLFNRADIASVGFSVEAMYTFKTDGVIHWVEPTYEIPYADVGNFDYYLVEGSGSDFCFFTELFGNKAICPTFNNTFSEGGRTKIKKLLESNLQTFKYNTLLLFVDICAFGSNYDELLVFSSVNCINIKFAKSYKSFEYLMLNTNLFMEFNIHNNFLAYKSEEVMYEDILHELTKNKSYSYSKSISGFKTCYIYDCCKKKDYNCDLFAMHIKNKMCWLLNDTIFSYLLKFYDKNVQLMTSEKIVSDATDLHKISVF